MVPEQAGEVPTERAELGDEPGRLRGQGDGGRATAAPYQGVASSAAPGGEQRGIVAGRGRYHPGDSAIFLRRLLANDAAALRGANRRDRRLPRLRRERRPGKRRPAAVPSSSDRHPPRHPRRHRRERPERPEAAGTSLRLDLSSDAREYVTLSSEIESPRTLKYNLDRRNLSF